MEPVNRNTSSHIVSTPTFNVGRLLLRKIRKLLSFLNKSISDIFADTHASAPHIAKNLFSDIHAKVVSLEGRIAIIEQDIQKEEKELEKIISSFIGSAKKRDKAK